MNGERSVFNRLGDEIAQDMAIVSQHAGAVGAEDADDFYIDLVLAVVVHHQSFGHALSFVVTAPGADGVDIPPVVFGLRIDLGVAVDLGCGGQEDAGFDALGHAQHIQSPHDIDFGGFYRVELKMDGRSRAGHVIDLIDFEEDGQDNIVPDKFKAVVVQEMDNIRFLAGVKIIQTDDLLVVLE